MITLTPLRVVKVVKLLFKHINICFFGGNSRTETVRKRDPEPQELIDLRNRIDDMLAPLTGGTKSDGWDETDFGKGYNSTKDRVESSLSLYDSIMGQIKGLFQDGGDEMSDSYKNITLTGEVPQALLDNMNKSIQKGMNESLGTQLNALAGSGTVNSSAFTNAAKTVSREGSDALYKNYLTAYDSVLSNLDKGINTRNANLTDKANLALDAPTKLWTGLQTQFSPAYNFWKDWQTLYYGHDDYDTVVSSGK